MPEQNTQAAVTPPAEPTPGSAEYNAKMIALAEGSTHNGAALSTEPAKPAVVAKPEKPAAVPDKFWDADKGVVNYEAWAKSTSELEKQFTQARQNQPAQADTVGAAPANTGQPAAATAATAQPAAASTNTPATQQTPPAVDPAEAVKAARAKAEVDFNKNGKLSDETYKELEKVGYQRADVDAYVEGRKAAAQQYVNTLHTAAGSPEAYQKMVQWGSTTFTPAEQEAFNAAVRSGNAGQAQLAVNGLKARYTAEFGKTATTTVTTTPSNSGNANSPAFHSQGEMLAAMRDPRYLKGDPAYHAEVRAKIKGSMDQKIDIGVYA